MPANVLDVQSMLPNKFQSKTKNRWVLLIEGIDAYIVKTSARPTMVTEEIEIPWINSHRYLAGKTKFNTINVTLHDPIAPAGSQMVTEWMRLHFEAVSGRSGYADFYKRDIQLLLLDPIGTVIENWDIKGAFITEANYGELTYEDGNPIEISLTLRFDLAVQQY